MRADMIRAPVLSCKFWRAGLCLYVLTSGFGQVFLDVRLTRADMFMRKLGSVSSGKWGWAKSIKANAPRRGK